MAVQFDIDRLLSHLIGKRVGVIATPAAWLPGLGTLTDFLAERADVRGFLALEHGLRGELQDGVHFDAYTDPRTQCPVFSYYGGSRTFPRDFLEEVDVVVFQAQDVSHRAYTYKDSLADTLTAGAETGTEVVILDRPSPIAHCGCMGPLAPQFFPLPIPVLLPYTLGELGLWLKRENGIDVDLTVIPVLGWSRAMTWPETGLPWIPPSPNIPTIESVYAYACTGLLQHTNISEARGTCKPFEYIGAPFVDGQALAAYVSEFDLPGLAIRDVYFQPAFNKFEGEVCGGVHLMFTELRDVDPFRTMGAILSGLARLNPDSFELLKGFARWLDGDGEAWTRERVAELGVPEFVAEAEATGDAFSESIADLVLY
ncbi:MAG: DUF1343 domain-containing protein [Lentisphaerae bacterium]|nr:DUF1343 domain-containing protein [Lentisphaerota bacterium]MBT4815327.1 DUF1343 domain-containing protein [Lentisphaerota bacterium]MBT5609585.1 DUF1343 domain-containing protein [Lentisphaerota bacterium]MBT7057781.1 DUF1343 domain-containing protein [Lentisphaerota bacterium]MBT7843200.1 DUF1343 domain-containing protein [Lentisphaerota bacterium]